ncbi:AbrB/MazE/SpoVT family DNA-binding domain-containing protein [Inquilinus limosus]|uniref:SpoVT-AbrB domain-containing protein n=1 Tax=Inquilinus limosus MP06 TaxID=1398085 RepID=A0A0A0D9S2_9PROT|nr:AbrB/MazE/SpoVT family DNA-binding domain-containing protein [Inquilinus limosus]KGM34633.1 hypothetical protein P409_09165 [Inquilinus limosus MP06]
MRTNIRKWGNSAAVRIPASIMQVAQISIGQSVDVWPESGGIVIEPALEDGIVGADLDPLLKGITEENQSDLVDFGPPDGKEL